MVLEIDGAKMGFDADGWFVVDDLRGWEDYSIRLKAESVKGRPRATALEVTCTTATAPIPLTAQRLGRLPLQSLAETAALLSPESRKARENFFNAEVVDALERLTSAPDDTDHSDPRSVVTPRRVAEVWLKAYLNNNPAPRRAVVDELGIGERTADNKINQAEELGLIPSELRRRRRAPKNQ